MRCPARSPSCPFADRASPSVNAEVPAVNRAYPANSGFLERVTRFSNGTHNTHGNFAAGGPDCGAEGTSGGGSDDRPRGRLLWGFYFANISIPSVVLLLITECPCFVAMRLRVASARLG